MIQSIILLIVNFSGTSLLDFVKRLISTFENNQAVLIDDVVQLFSSQTLDFYQAVKFKESIELEDDEGKILDVFFRYDEDYDIYERRIYSFWDFLGQIGGLEQSLLIIGSVF